MTKQQTLCVDQPADSSQPTSNVWRKEIHARVAGYRSRRGRRIEGAFTMRFPFPPEPAESTTAAEPAAEPVAESALISEEESEAALSIAAVDPEPRPAPLPRPSLKRKVIAFPRQGSEAPAIAYRLADPVVPEEPRILDVPEELEAFPGTPLLDGLQFPASAQQTPEAPADHIELPFQAIGIPQRLYAGLIDCAIVAGGAGIFGAVAYKMLPKLQMTKPVLLTAAAALVLLWAVYEYVLTVYGGATAGMRVAKICLSTFKGARPNLRHRRSRVIGLYFSTASLLMGLLWVLVDVDVLCWHDRISRTYLTNRQ